MTQRELEYQELDMVYSKYHVLRCGKGKRNDVVDARKTYESILIQYYDNKYSNIIEFIRQSFDYFCRGFLSIHDQQTELQNFPIVWGISKNRYSYYVDLGKSLTTIVPVEQLQQYIFSNPNIQDQERTSILWESEQRFYKLLQSMQQTLPASLFQLYIGSLKKSKISFKGVEIIARLMIQPVMEFPVSIRGEFYKLLYQYVYPKLGEEYSIRLLS